MLVKISGYNMRVNKYNQTLNKKPAFGKSADVIMHVPCWTESAKQAVTDDLMLNVYQVAFRQFQKNKEGRSTPILLSNVRAIQVNNEGEKIGYNAVEGKPAQVILTMDLYDGVNTQKTFHRGQFAEGHKGWLKLAQRVTEFFTGRALQ